MLFFSFFDRKKKGVIRISQLKRLEYPMFLKFELWCVAIAIFWEWGGGGGVMNEDLQVEI